MKQVVIKVSADGSIQHLYSDNLNEFDLLVSDERSINRASNVEPNKNGKWEVELKTGEKLINPITNTVEFDRRDDAIQFEIEEINRRLTAGTWN